jgi:hypothetical protein
MPSVKSIFAMLTLQALLSLFLLGPGPNTLSIEAPKDAPLIRPSPTVYMFTTASHREADPSYIMSLVAGAIELNSSGEVDGAGHDATVSSGSDPIFYFAFDWSPKDQERIVFHELIDSSFTLSEPLLSSHRVTPKPSVRIRIQHRDNDSNATPALLYCYNMT